MKSRLCLVSVFALSACAITNPYYGEIPGSGDMSGTVPPDPNADMSFQGCVTSEYKADQAPAALMVVLDRSPSMAQNNKWATVAQAVVQALDQQTFDSMYLGLYASPSPNTINGPMCLGSFFQVACAAPPFPEVDLAVAGSARSGDASGVRRSIKDRLNQLTPAGGLGDASPLYAALDSAGNYLKNWNQNGKRILFVVTDGNMSCASYSSRPAYKDCNGCNDWENPSNIVNLLTTFRTDANAPIETFVLGGPGADSYDSSGCQFAPYRMRMALSAIAYAGAPNSVPASCDGRTYSQSAPNPTQACHFDMTTSFSAQNIANAIAQVRGQVVGCAYELPKPQSGTVINKNQINVKVQTPSDTRDLLRRKTGTTTCTDCWDYNAQGKVELYGKTCDDVKAGLPVTVKILAGCDTIIG